MQQLYFIRHAIAMEREQHIGSDLKRPLTEEGRTKARKAFQGLARIAEQPALIISSRATRAIQTADVLREFWSEAEYVEQSDLNPGADAAEILNLLRQYAGQSPVALVGHEPDFSETIGELISMDGSAAVQVKKASFIELMIYAPGQAELVGAIAPRVLRRLAR